MNESSSHPFYGSFSGESDERNLGSSEEIQTTSPAKNRRNAAGSWVVLVVVALVGLYSGTRYGGSTSIVSLDIIDELVPSDGGGRRHDERQHDIGASASSAVAFHLDWSYFFFYVAAPTTHSKQSRIYSATDGYIEEVQNYTTDAYAIKLDPRNDTVFWTTTGGQIWSSSFTGKERTLLYDYPGTPRGLDINPHHQDIYWADIEHGNINRGDYFGSRNMTIRGGLSGVFDVRLMMEGSSCKKLYASLPEQNMIVSMLCNGAEPSVFLADIGNPHGIELEISSYFIFWVDGGAVQRATLDGGNVTVLHNSSNSNYFFVEKNPTRHRIYLSDYTQDSIWAMDYDGTNRTLVANVTRPLGISTTTVVAPTVSPSTPPPSVSPTAPMPTVPAPTPIPRSMEGLLADTTPKPTTPSPTFTRFPTLAPSATQMPTITPVPSAIPTTHMPTAPSPMPTGWCSADYSLFYSCGYLNESAFVKLYSHPATMADTNQTNFAETDKDIYGLHWYGENLFISDGNGTVATLDLLAFNWTILYYIPGSNPRGITYNPYDNMVYWADASGLIYYGSIDGDEYAAYGVLNHNITNPFDLQIYDYEGSCHKIFVSSPDEGIIYQLSCEHPSTAPSILIDGLIYPRGMAIDNEHQDLFFCDGNSVYVQDLYNITADDREGKRIVATFNKEPMFIALDKYCDRLFVSVPDENKIWGIDLRGKFKIILVKHIHRPRGVAIYDANETWAPTLAPTPEPSAEHTPSPSTTLSREEATSAWEFDDDEANSATTSSGSSKGSKGNGGRTGNWGYDKTHSTGDDEYHFKVSADDDIFDTDQKNGGLGAHLGGSSPVYDDDVLPHKSGRSSHSNRSTTHLQTSSRDQSGDDDTSSSAHSESSHISRKSKTSSSSDGDAASDTARSSTRSKKRQGHSKSDGKSSGADDDASSSSGSASSHTSKSKTHTRSGSESSSSDDGTSSDSSNGASNSEVHMKTSSESSSSSTKAGGTSSSTRVSSGTHAGRSKEESSMRSSQGGSIPEQPELSELYPDEYPEEQSDWQGDVPGLDNRLRFHDPGIGFGLMEVHW